MKISVVNFSCRPESGSEWGVGWNFLLFYSETFDEVRLYIRDAEDQVRRTQERLTELNISNCTIIPVADFNPFKFSYRGRYEIINYFIWLRKVLLILIIRRDWRHSDFISQPTWVSDWNWSPILFLPYKRKVFGPLGSQPQNFVNRKKGPISRIRQLVKVILRLNPVLFLNAAVSDHIINGVKSSADKFPWCIFKNKILNIPSVHSEFPPEICLNNTQDNNLEIFFVGKYLDFKNIELFCEICRYALKKNNNLNVSFFGDRINGNRTVENLSYDYPDRVKEYGSISHDDLKKKLLETKSILLQTAAEHGGTISVEAVALSVPIICCKSMGIDAMLVDDYPLTFSATSKDIPHDVWEMIEKVDGNYEQWQEYSLSLAELFSRERTISILKQALRT
ncbi:MAG: hypothetical protein ACI9SC_000709 [Gammaproteobacteria bacterium]|jgi:hypothetical protein